MSRQNCSSNRIIFILNCDTLSFIKVCVTSPLWCRLTYLRHYPPPFSFNFIPHLPHFHAAHPYAAPPAVGVTPDHGTAPSVTGLSRFIPGIISYQPLTFPLGPALNSSAPEQRSTARHNWGRYRSPMAAILQCFYPHLHSTPPSLCLPLCGLS